MNCMIVARYLSTVLARLLRARPPWSRCHYQTSTQCDWGCIRGPFGEGGFEAFEAFEGEGSKGEGEGRGGGGAEGRKASKGEDEGFEGFEGEDEGFEG